MDTTLFLRNIRISLKEKAQKESSEVLTGRFLVGYEELENMPTNLEGWEWKIKEERKNSVVIMVAVKRVNI